MRRAVLGTLLGAVVIIAAMTVSEPEHKARAEGPVPGDLAEAVAPLAASAGELIALTTPGDDKASLLTVIDVRRQVVSVYGIERATGKISLLSVRRIQWDLEMNEFNGEHPLPREIRALMQPR